MAPSVGRCGTSPGVAEQGRGRGQSSVRRDTSPGGEGDPRCVWRSIRQVKIEYGGVDTIGDVRAPRLWRKVDSRRRCEIAVRGSVQSIKYERRRRWVVRANYFSRVTLVVARGE